MGYKIYELKEVWLPWFWLGKEAEDNSLLSKRVDEEKVFRFAVMVDEALRRFRA